MPRPHPGRTAVFHIIPIEKLGSVIEHGLLCDALAQVRFGSQPATDAAHADLKAARRAKGVTVARGGVMSDYVPFYFGPRSPMLFSIKCGYTNYGRNGRGQPGMIHLVCHMERLAQGFADAWGFIDAHLTRDWALFGDTLPEPDQRIDFDVMTARMWDSPDELRAARQAEFLVHGVVPWEYVELIVVMRDDVAAEVDVVITDFGAQHRPQVHVRPPGHYPESTFPHGYYYG